MGGGLTPEWLKAWHNDGIDWLCKVGDRVYCMEGRRPGYICDEFHNGALYMYSYSYSTEGNRINLLDEVWSREIDHDEQRVLDRAKEVMALDCASLAALPPLANTLFHRICFECEQERTEMLDTGAEIEDDEGWICSECEEGME